MNEFRKLRALINRNVKVYFKDKTLFFVSLITPIILVVLFLTFLGNVYTESLTNVLGDGVDVSNRLIKGFTGGWLFSSILATSCVTVAFCSNVMVNDKINHVIDDFNITPVRKSTISVSYFVANFLTTLIVCVVAFAVGLLYLAIVGWYLSFVDVLMLLLCIVMNTMLGTLLASIIGMFIKTQGALSGVCTLLSSMYGFLVGAYMPISQFAPGIQTFVGFLPGTYITVLFRHYFMRGALGALDGKIPDAVVTEVNKSFDGTISMFGHNVPVWVMFIIALSTIAVLFVIYVLLAYRKSFKLRIKEKKGGK